MTKHTNKLLVTFEHPEILQQFNDYFIDKHGTVRGHRTKVLEELISNFNRTQTIQKYKPEYLQKIDTLQVQLQELKKENTQSSINYNKLLVENKKNLQQIEELTTKLENDHLVIEENVRLHETIKKHENTIDNMNTIQETQKNRIIELKEELKNNKHNIDDLNKKVDNLEAKYEQTLINHNDDIKQLSMEYNKNLEEKEERINEKDKKIEEKEEENKALTGVIIKLNNDISKIKQMNMIQRIFKRYPEEKIIELKQP